MGTKPHSQALYNGAWVLQQGSTEVPIHRTTLGHLQT